MSQQFAFTGIVDNSYIPHAKRLLNELAKENKANGAITQKVKVVDGEATIIARILGGGIQRAIIDIPDFILAIALPDLSLPHNDRTLLNTDKGFNIETNRKGKKKFLTGNLYWINKKGRSAISYGGYAYYLGKQIELTQETYAAALLNNNRHSFDAMFLRIKFAHPYEASIYRLSCGLQGATWKESSRETSGVVFGFNDPYLYNVVPNGVFVEDASMLFVWKEKSQGIYDTPYNGTGRVVKTFLLRRLDIIKNKDASDYTFSGDPITDIGFIELANWGRFYNNISGSGSNHTVSEAHSPQGSGGSTSITKSTSYSTSFNGLEETEVLMVGGLRSYGDYLYGYGAKTTSVTGGYASTLESSFFEDLRYEGPPNPAPGGGLLYITRILQVTSQSSSEASSKTEHQEQKIYPISIHRYGANIIYGDAIDWATYTDIENSHGSASSESSYEHIAGKAPTSSSTNRSSNSGSRSISSISPVKIYYSNSFFNILVLMKSEYKETGTRTITTTEIGKPNFEHNDTQSRVNETKNKVVIIINGAETVIYEDQSSFVDRDLMPLLGAVNFINGSDNRVTPTATRGISRAYGNGWGAETTKHLVVCINDTLPSKVKKTIIFNLNRKERLATLVKILDYDAREFDDGFIGNLCTTSF